MRISLSSRPGWSIYIVFQGSQSCIETLCQKTKPKHRDKTKGDGPEVDLWPLHPYAYICTCTRRCVSIYTHTQRNTNVKAQEVGLVSGPGILMQDYMISFTTPSNSFTEHHL